MKKLLIATAALAMVAGTAQAQSSVTAYGILDIGYSDLSTTAASAAGAAVGATTDTKGINAGSGLSSSRLGFKGTEDLGGGLTAGFVYELGITAENATTAHSTRQALVSLASKSVGSLNFGRGNTLGKNHNDGFSAFGGGASFEQGAVAFEVTRGKALADATATKTNGIVDRASNQATYVSPSFGGVTLSAQLVAKSVDSDAAAKAGETSSSGTAFQLAYAGNGFTAAYTRSDLDTEVEAVAAVANTSTAVGGSLGSAAVAASKSETKLDQFGATYTMGGFKVFGLYNTVKYKATVTTAEAENKGYDIGATYTMGKTTLLASVGDGEMTTAAGATTDVTGYQAQVRYALSGRTTAYALYGKTEYKQATTGESDVTMIGVRHSF
ncbi:porin [Polynucleobacter sp. 30F-ANTBAC]|uniref:porin n=1 Tax=Polynucleobacter sp. 30F-ANTBAC TaxID=2689095 RepID=UPI001C0C6174|nr:porin [Polynucleobacter sp. 30F-ANTBAC]MBU3599908.1 porin [Polynucleobacter sp. 30F-ANTBAC]